MVHSSEKTIVTRFAPSPTGYLHVGGLRTALYSYLFAKKHGGTFLLRIEDTDRERFVADGVKNILDSLYWAGIVSDQGVCLDNEEHIVERCDHGPYIQSERLPIYKKYADELIAKGVAYYCFCTRERLDAVRKEKQDAGLVPKYDRHCLTLSKEEIDANLASGTTHVVRLKIPDEGMTTFFDDIRGEISYPNKDLDDQVLMKSDGFPTYHMAVVVDDHEMQVTHVIRGEEWISSTPKHIILYKAFGWDIPNHAHLPLLLNADRSKLSKRQGDVAVLDYTKKSYLPEAMNNFVAFLGWNPGTEQELFALDELVRNFSLEKVSKSGAFFNVEKLDWYNREYLKLKSDNEVARALLEYVPEVCAVPGFSNDMFEKIVPAIRERIAKYTDLAEMIANNDIQFFFAPPVYEKDLLIPKKSTPEITKQHLETLVSMLQPVTTWNKDSIKDAVWDYATEKGRGEVLWPMRVALSGLEKSPDPFSIADIVGKEETISRITYALSTLSI